MSKDLNQLLYALNGKKIAYDVIYTKITGRLTAGIMLSQLIYWSGTKNGGEFYKTNEELCEETGLSLDELKAAKKILLSKNLITVTFKSLSRRTYYKVNEQQVINTLTSEWKLHHTVGGNSTDLMVETPHTTSENTTENTTEITTDIARPKKFSSLESITDAVIDDIARTYNVPSDYVWDCFDSAKNWLDAHGKKMKDYKAFLSNWVKKDNKDLMLKKNQSNKFQRRGGYAEITE